MQLQAKAFDISFEQIINDRLNDFDVISLLRLLKHNGYGEQSMWFSSHNNITSQNRVIESVRLTDDAAYIEMNIGILASTGILPEHIRKFMDRPDVDENQLQRFFQLFDHLLISNYLGQLYPEVNRIFFNQWAHTQTCYLELQNIRSEASMHWLLNTAFPEFKIALVKYAPDTKRPHSKPRLGRMTLGHEIPPKIQSEKVGFKIYLLLRPTWHDILSSWQVKVKKRITEWIIPLLRDFSMEVTFYLCITRSDTHLKLRKHSVLGHDPFFSKNKLHHDEQDDQYDYSVFVHHESLPHIPNKPEPKTVWNDDGRISL